MRIFNVLFVLFLVIGLGCQNKKAGPVAAAVPVPANATVDPSIINEDAQGLSPNIYYVPIVETKSLSCGEDQIKSIKNAKGQTMAQVCEIAYKACVAQGTCLLKESRGLRLINFTTRRGKIPVFTDKTKKECPYGLGNKSICLDPFYTIAADLNFYKTGDVIFIPTVRGVVLPNRETHDGYFIVRDSAESLTSEKRFDFFIGFTTSASEPNIFKDLGLMNEKNKFKFEKVPDSIAVKVRKNRAYPKITRKQQAEAAEFLKSAIAK